MLRPASLRVYLPELGIVEPAGQIVEYLDRCYDSVLLAPNGIEEIPCGFYWTSCDEPIVHNYLVRGVPYDEYGYQDCCFHKQYTDGSNPCGYDCTSACPDATHWWDFLPDPLPEFPLVLVDDAVNLAVDDNDDLWWY